MNQTMQEFRRGAVGPWQSFVEGWRLVKNQYWTFFGISLVGYIIASAIPLGILMGPMMCGIYLSLLKKMQGENMLFETLFKGFDYFSTSLIASLIQIGFAFVAMVPAVVLLMIFAYQQEASGGTAGSLFLGISVVLMFAYSVISAGLFIFTYQLIVDKNLSGWEAVKTSFRAYLGNFWGLLGLCFLPIIFFAAIMVIAISVMYLAPIVGVLLCLIAIFALIAIYPVIIAALAVAYRNVFPVGI